MLPAILALATLAITTPAPITVQFTQDSVYKNESIITPTSLVEQEDGLYTLTLEEDKLLGYCIYDKSDTEYIDGLKFDDKFVYNFVITDVDLSVEHTILIKTVYTDDVAGMLAAAKNGDWSRLLSNPLVILQLAYYALAAISIILGGFGLFKSKKKKIKTANEIAAVVSEQAALGKDALIETVVSVITPLIQHLNSQNSDIIKALIMSKSGDDNDMLALLDLLKKAGAEDNVTELVDRIKHDAEEAFNSKKVNKEKAQETIKAIASGTFEPETSEGGIENTDEVRF